MSYILPDWCNNTNWRSSRSETETGEMAATGEYEFMMSTVYSKLIVSNLYCKAKTGDKIAQYLLVCIL